MGKYLDIAAAVIAGPDSDSQCEISELSEISPPVSAGLHCEKSERSEKSPHGETWGTAAASTKVVLLHCPTGVPEVWAQGVADLLTMVPPTSYPRERWMVLREDTYLFLSDWAAQAHRLGWTGFDVFGVHRHRPQVRFDCMGLVPLLRGRAVAALAEDRAVIETTESRTLTFRRESGARPNEACLIWELSQ